MAGQDNAQAADAAVEQAQPRTSGLPPVLMFGLFGGVIGWFYLGTMLWMAAEKGSLSGIDWLYVLPPLAWAAPLALMLLRSRRGLEAFCALLLFPLALSVHYVLFSLSDALWVPGRALEEITEIRRIGIAVLFGAAWFALAWARHQWMTAPDGEALRGLRKAAGLVEMLLIIVLLLTVAVYVTGLNQHEGYSVRSRVSELILAGSSAKTALSEGMQTYGSWSPEWMSSITISATGMISSAHIGPAGVITIYGTAPTSGSAVTMTPTITTDNKLVWSCTGSPARYMPASCR
jgi:type IV pilus assembly protein PilA